MLENGSNMYMPVAPAGNYAGGGFMGDGAWWIIILFLFAFVGRGGLFGGNGGYDQGNPGAYMQRGFDQQAVMSALNGVTAAVSGLSNQICNSTNTIQQTVSQGFAAAEQGANARAMAGMERDFASQTAITSALTSMQAQQANCCCENRLAVAGLNATIASENCADRQAVADAARDILANQNAGIQRILDTMCQDKIDAKNERIATLERQLTMAQMEASNVSREARILADNAAQTVALEQYLHPVPIPAYAVQNPNCCPNPYYNYGYQPCMG